MTYMKENNRNQQLVKKNDVRKIALQLLESYEAEGRYVNLLLSSPRLDSLSNEEKTQLTALLYTTVEKSLPTII